MKYGEIFESESVPEWSLHNVDYNALKHLIKVHTTKDQATAIAIPGHPDSGLKRFEDELYLELCRQHDRVDLFVTSKADEITRRLRYLSDQTQRLAVRCAQSNRTRLSLKRQRKFSRYEEEAVSCADDAAALQRFVSAQAIAFRKIVKKYKKWTGSTALGSRFKEAVLGSPKSFTRRDLRYLQTGADELLATIRAASNSASAAGSVSDGNAGGQQQALASRRAAQQAATPQQQQQPQHYWNEYDDGSEGVGAEHEAEEDGEYAIYITPGSESSFPAVGYVLSAFAAPAHKLRDWIARKRGGPETTSSPAPPTSEVRAVANAGTERSPLLGVGPTGYFTLPPPATSATTTTATSDDDEALSSSTASSPTTATQPRIPFPSGYEAHYAAHSSAQWPHHRRHLRDLPSIRTQRLALLRRERILTRVAAGAMAAAAALLAVAALLLATGRHRLRVEVDAGATVGVVGSLCCAGAALASALAMRSGEELGYGHGYPTGRDRVWWKKAVVWAMFVVCCVANGVVLVLVVGN